MSRHFILGTLCLLGFTSAATPQVDVASAARVPLTVRGATEEALARNPELLALRQEFEAARAAPAQERYLMPPMFEAQIWGWPVTTLNPARTDMYMLMAEQEVPGRGKRAARVLVAERETEMSRQQIAVRANDILNDVKQAFVDLALARDAAALYARQSMLLQDIAEAATLRYASGEGAQHHTITSLVELARLEKERIGADEHAQVAEARLNTLLGRSVAQPIEVLDSVTATISPADAEHVALTRHPELAMAAAAIAKEEAELERLRGERRPDFVVGGGYMLTPGEAGAWTARAGLTWPNAPWSRGKLTTAIDVQSKRVDAARARHELVATQIRHIVREAVVRLAAAERQARLLESTILPQVEHAFELARLVYAGGEGAFTDIVDARRMLLSVQLEHVEARANAARARADLETAAGGGV